MPTIQANLQGFAQIANNAAQAAKDVRISHGSQGDAIQTRGTFMTRLVEIFQPQKARAEHRAAAEAFVNAIANSLGSSSSRGVLLGAEVVSGDQKNQVVASLRQSLHRQLEGGERLTGADVAQALAKVKNDVVLAGHLSKVEEMVGRIDRALDGYRQLEPILAEQDSQNQLDSHSAQLLSSVHDNIQIAQKLYQNIKANQSDVDEHIRQFLFDANPEVKTEWRAKMNAFNASNQRLNDRIDQIQDASGAHLGIAFKVEKALDRHEVARTFDSDRLRVGQQPEPLHQPQAGAIPIPDAPERGILKASEHPILVDPNPKWVDDGTNTEPEEDNHGLRDAAEDAALSAAHKIRQANLQAAAQPSNKTDFTVGFAPSDVVAEYPKESVAQAAFDERASQIRQRTQSVSDSAVTTDENNSRPRSASV